MKSRFKLTMGVMSRIGENYATRGVQLPTSLMRVNIPDKEVKCRIVVNWSVFHGIMSFQTLTPPMFFTPLAGRWI